MLHCRVDDLTPECLASIGKHCANLNRLHLDACRRVNDAALKEVGGGEGGGAGGASRVFFG